MAALKTNPIIYSQLIADISDFLDSKLVASGEWQKSFSLDGKGAASGDAFSDFIKVLGSISDAFDAGDFQTAVDLITKLGSVVEAMDFGILTDFINVTDAAGDDLLLDLLDIGPRGGSYLANEDGSSTDDGLLGGQHTNGLGKGDTANDGEGGSDGGSTADSLLGGQHTTGLGGGSTSNESGEGGGGNTEDSLLGGQHTTGIPKTSTSDPDGPVYKADMTSEEMEEFLASLRERLILKDGDDNGLDIQDGAALIAMLSDTKFDFVSYPSGEGGDDGWNDILLSDLIDEKGDKAEDFWISVTIPGDFGGDLGGLGPLDPIAGGDLFIHIDYL